MTLQATYKGQLIALFQCSNEWHSPSKPA